MKAIVDDAEEEIALGLMKGGRESGTGRIREAGDGGGKADAEASTLQEAQKRIQELEKEVSDLRLRLSARPTEK